MLAYRSAPVADGRFAGLLSTHADTHDARLKETFIGPPALGNSDAMNHCTPVSAAAGGALIGLAAVLLLWLNGRIAGVSGVAGGLWFSAAGERAWRVLFLIGLIAGAGGWVAWTGHAPAPRPGFPAVLLVVAGVLVGLWHLARRRLHQRPRRGVASPGCRCVRWSRRWCSSPSRSSRPSSCGICCTSPEAAMSSVRSLLRSAAALLAGLAFGVGLTVAKMVDPLRACCSCSTRPRGLRPRPFVLCSSVRTALRSALPSADRHGRRQAARDRRGNLGHRLGVAGYCPGPGDRVAGREIPNGVQ